MRRVCLYVHTDARSRACATLVCVRVVRAWRVRVRGLYVYSVQPTNHRRQANLDAVETFAGKMSITKAMIADGLQVVPFELELRMP